MTRPVTMRPSVGTAITLRRRRAYVIGIDFTYNHREESPAIERERYLLFMEIVGNFRRDVWIKSEVLIKCDLGAVGFFWNDFLTIKWCVQIRAL